MQNDGSKQTNSTKIRLPQKYRLSAQNKPKTSVKC